VEKQLVMIFD